jgi:hypothetical protein
MVDPLFLHICYLEVARQQLSLEDAPRMIVCDTRGLLEAVAQLARGLGFEVFVRGRGWLAFDRLRGILNWILLAVFYWIHFTHRRLICVTTRRGDLAVHLKTNARKLIYVTFFDDDNLTTDETFHDRYIPGLVEWLDVRGWEVWILPIIGYRSWSAKQYRWVRSSRSNIILPEDWLRLSDYASVFLTSIATVRFPTNVPQLAGLDVSALTFEARRRQATVNSTRLAGLLDRVPMRLAHAGFSPERVISWSENQVYDKAIFKGSRRAFPKAGLTAVQNNPLFPNCLNNFRTPAEYQAGVSGDRVVCSGPLPARLLADASRGLLLTRVGCGPRYAYLDTQSPREPRKRQGPIEALIALPSSLAQSVAIMDLIREVQLTVNWHVKCHPDYDQSDLVGALDQPLPSAIELVDGRLVAWLDRVDVVVTTGSGSALEAVAAGVPVIVVGSPNELTFNPLDWFTHESFRPAFTSAELDERLAGLRSGEVDFGRLAREVRQSWFSPVTEGALEEFIA